MLEARCSNHLQLKGKSQTTIATTIMLLEWYQYAILSIRHDAERGSLHRMVACFPASITLPLTARRIMAGVMENNVH
jgi:hypothetical protein